MADSVATAGARLRRGSGAALLAAAAAVLSAAATAGDAEKGGELYAEKCVLCHGAGGTGWDWSKRVEKPPIPVPDLTRVVPMRSDRYLFEIVRGGGEAVGKTRLMPPFAFQLSEQEVWDIVAYLRTLGGKKES
ncbi:MAG TPA: cytochrome c [candidate division Zixibacteria bacterium]|nr:cytochrome c [candidate division Zixibacteria bacterium]